MRCLSLGGCLLTAVVVIAGAIEKAQANPASSRLESRQDGPSNSPETSKFLRRHAGTVTVLGNRVYFDGGSVSEEGFQDWRPSNPTNTTLSIDLSTSWSPATVSISEIRRPNSPTLHYQTAFIDEAANCFYVWGGFPKFGIPIPTPRRFWRFCNNGDEQGAWEEVNLPDVNEFRQLANMAFAASASTKDAGFVFGGREYRSTPVDGTENSKHFLSYNYTTLSWKWHDLPDHFSIDRTLWGSKAIYVPNYGPNGLIFLLGGITGKETAGQAYLTFRKIHFMDPVTKEWYSQDTTATSDGFPGTRHEHCVAGIAGANNTYEIYVFGGANSEVQSGYDSMYVLSLPSFTWSLAGRVSKEKIRESHDCAIVGNSQFLSWGGIDFGGEEVLSTEDPFPQGLGIFNLNTFEWADEYKPDGAPYTAHSNVVAARRATPTQWSSEEVSGFFNPEEASTESETPPPSDGNGSSSSPPVAAIAGGVVGGVVLVAAAAAVWFFVSRRRRARVPPATQDQNTASGMTQYELVPGSTPQKYPAELHEQYQPAEMTGQGKELPRPVHEMDGGYGHSRQ